MPDALYVVICFWAHDPLAPESLLEVRQRQDRPVQPVTRIEALCVKWSGKSTAEPCS